MNEPEMLNATSVADLVEKRKRHVENILDPIAHYLRGGGTITIIDSCKLIGDQRDDLEKRIATEKVLRDDSRFHCFIENGLLRIVLARIAQENPEKYISQPVPTLGERIAEAEAAASDGAPLATSVSEPISQPDAPAPAGTIISLAVEDMTEVQRLEARIRQLETENEAFREHVATEKEAAAEVERCKDAVESAKAVVSARKIDLADAHDQLVAVVTGVAPQPKDKALTPDEDTDEIDPDRNYVAPLPAPVRTPNDPPAIGSSDIAGRVGAWRARLSIPAEKVVALASVGLTADLCAQMMGPVAHLAPSEKPQQVSGVEAFQRTWLVLDGYEGGPWMGVPLYTKDEFGQLHAEEYGNAIVGFDQDKEVRERRQAGGLRCGLVVKIGRKSLVVGPLKDALIFVPDQAAPAVAAKVADEVPAPFGEQPEA